MIKSTELDTTTYFEKLEDNEFITKYLESDDDPPIEKPFFHY
jgi:hypothetical protein